MSFPLHVGQSTNSHGGTGPLPHAGHQVAVIARQVQQQTGTQKTETLTDQAHGVGILALKIGKQPHAEQPASLGHVTRVICIRPFKVNQQPHPQTSEALGQGLIPMRVAIITLDVDGNGNMAGHQVTNRQRSLVTIVAPQIDNQGPRTGKCIVVLAQNNDITHGRRNLQHNACARLFIDEKLAFDVVGAASRK